LRTVLSSSLPRRGTPKQRTTCGRTGCCAAKIYKGQGRTRRSVAGCLYVSHAFVWQSVCHCHGNLQRTSRLHTRGGRDCCSDRDRFGRSISVHPLDLDGSLVSGLEDGSRLCHCASRYGTQLGDSPPDGNICGDGGLGSRRTAWNLSCVALNGGCWRHLAELYIHEIVSVPSRLNSSTFAASRRLVETTCLRVAAQFDSFDASCP
jgi:hypothetical protein